MGDRDLRERYEMSESGNLELVNAESVNAESVNAESADVLHSIPEEPSPDLVLRSSAARLARSLAWMPGRQESRDFSDRSRLLSDSLQPLLAALEAPAKIDSDDYQRLRQNVPLLKGELEEMRQTFSLPHKIPQVRTPDGEVASRVAALAQNFLADVSYKFSEPAFTFYIEAFQEVTVLKLAELWMIVPAMRLALLEQITDQGSGLVKNPSSSCGIQQLLRSLQEMKQVSWKLVIEPLIVFDQVLREDPAGAYAGMDYESR